jgi:hypothetical protein
MKRRLKKKLRADLKRELDAAKAACADRKLSRQEIADNIKLTVGAYYRAKARAVFPELGLCRGGRLRADLLVLAMTGHTVVVEVKSSVSDFRTDKKMRKYLAFASQAYVAMTKGTYLKVADEIDPEFGVFIMSKDGLTIRKVKRARNRVIKPEVAQNLAIRAAFRSMDKSGRKNKALV